MSARVLVAYDGSAAAEAAVATAGQLFTGATGRLLTVVDLPSLLAGVHGFGPGLDAATMQRGLEAVSQEMMEHGAGLAARGNDGARAPGRGAPSPRQRTTSTPR